MSNSVLLRGLAALLLAAVVTASPGDARALQASQNVLNANFDQGLGQWVVSFPIGGVGWAADNTPAVVPPSPPNSLNYNNGVNFAGGAAVQGTADSPPFNLTGATSVTLSFQCRWDTENSNFYDQKWVRMSNNNFATNIFDTQLWTGAVAPGAACGPQFQWHSHQFPIIGAAVNNVQLRFFFNSVDGAGNGGAGWAVDNVIVAATGLAPPPAPPATGGGGAATVPDKDNDDEFDNRIDELREENCGSGASSSGWMLLAACVLAAAAGLARRA